jgi:hypothetical protein
MGGVEGAEPPPFYFLVWQAANVLPQSFFTLLAHPDIFELMHLAFTIQQGQSDGEHLAKLNTDILKQFQVRRDEEDKAWQKVAPKRG